MNKEKVLNIPEHWGEANLGSIIKVSGGKRVPKGDELLDENTGYPYLRITDLKNNSVKTEKLKYINEDTYNKIRNYTINSSDLYITVAGTIGEVGVIPSEVSGANLTENANKLSKYENIFNKMFLLFLLNSDFLKTQINNKTKQVAQPKLSIENINKFLLIVPPKGEQERIVQKIESCFTKIEATESNLNKIENLLAKYKESILSKAFRGELVPRIEKEGNGWELLEEAIGKKIPKNKRNSELNIPEHWGESELENCVNVFYGKGLTEKERIDGIYPVISSAGVVGFHNNFIFEGPLVVTGRKGSLGKPIFIKENCWVIDTAFALKPKLSLKTIFLFWWLKNQNIIELQSSTAIPSLTRETLYKLIFPVPPLKEQERIVQKIEHYFSKIEEIEKQVKQKRILLKKLKESILTKAFSGHFVERIESEGTGHDLLKEILNENKKHEKVKKSIPVKKHLKKIKNENNECRI